ncbi:MAG: hypothetical protein ACI9F9_001859 [Candidatus Paceibacteria bacterium]|jgi:hypothetical protein
MTPNKAPQQILSVGTLGALLFLPGLALAQQPRDQKIEPASRSVLDLKTPARPIVEKVGRAILAAPQPPTATLAAPRERTSLGDDLGPTSLEGLVLFDEAGDGTLWAAGGYHYKASFDRSGFTYIPFLGSDAPTNYPVSFSLQEVTFGEEAIDFDHKADYSRSESMVSYDRGGFIELYDIQADHAEQLFVFSERPFEGDMTLSIAVTSELVFADGPQGFQFKNDLGHVNYGRATAIDSAGRKLELKSTYADGVIQLHIPSQFVSSAQFPLTVDPVISTFSIYEVSGDNSFNPDVAYDQSTDRYMVAWEQKFSTTDHDVYSSLWYSNGQFVSGSIVAADISSWYWANPSVANNQIANSFLLAAEKGNFSAGGPYDIVGRIRAATSNLAGAEILISGNFGGDKHYPDVGGDPATVGPTYFCVVWERTFSNSDHDIHYQMVRADGTLLNASTQLLQNNGNDQRKPRVSKGNGQPPFASQEWNVAWEEVWSNDDHDVYAAQIHWDGSITAPSFGVSLSNENEIEVEVSTLLDDITPGYARPFMVVYTTGQEFDRTTYGSLCIANENLSGNQNLSLLDTPYSSSGDQLHPAIDSDGTCFSLVYAERQSHSGSLYDVYIATLKAYGSHISVIESHRQMSADVDLENQAQITSKRSASSGALSEPNRFMAVWSDLRQTSSGSTGDIEAGFYDSVCDDCAVVSPSCPTTPSSLGVAATISIGTDCDPGTIDLLTATPVTNKPGLFFHGPTDAILPLGCGYLCITGGYTRHPTLFASGNVASQWFLPSALGITPGSSASFQYWFRDPVGCGSGFGLSDVVRVYYH